MLPQDVEARKQGWVVCCSARHGRCTYTPHAAAVAVIEGDPFGFSSFAAQMALSESVDTRDWDPLRRDTRVRVLSEFNRTLSRTGRVDAVLMIATMTSM